MCRAGVTTSVVTPGSSRDDGTFALNRFNLGEIGGIREVLFLYAMRSVL